MTTRRALELVYELAEQNALDGSDAEEMPRAARQQQAALNIVSSLISTLYPPRKNQPTWEGR